MDADERGDRAVPGGDLLEEQRVCDGVDLRPVPRGGGGRAEEPQLAHFADDFRLDAAGFLAFGGVGCETVLREFASGFYNERVSFGCVIQHRSFPPSGGKPRRSPPRARLEVSAAGGSRVQAWAGPLHASRSLAFRSADRSNQADAGARLKVSLMPPRPAILPPVPRMLTCPSELISIDSSTTSSWTRDSARV